MTKAVASWIVSLASVAVLTAAQAQPARAPEPSRPGVPASSPAELAARHKQLCLDAYAHQVGDLAYLEAKLDLTPAQQPLFERWKKVKLATARSGEADCATRELSAQAGATPVENMAQQSANLKRRIADLDAERPVFTALFNSLNDSQKTALTHPGPEAMLPRHRLFADALAPRPGRATAPRQRGNGASPPPGPPPGAPPPQ